MVRESKVARLANQNESTHRENKDLYMIYALGAVEVVPLAQNL